MSVDELQLKKERKKRNRKQSSNTNGCNRNDEKNLFYDYFHADFIFRNF